MNKRDQRELPVARRIPDFQSREEEAQFRDTHDFTEFLDETQPVTLRIGKQLSEKVTVRLDRHDREELERRASEQGSAPQPWSACGSGSGCLVRSVPPNAAGLPPLRCCRASTPYRRHRS